VVKDKRRERVRNGRVNRQEYKGRGTHNPAQQAKKLKDDNTLMGGKLQSATGRGRGGVGKTTGNTLRAASKGRWEERIVTQSEFGLSKKRRSTSRWERTVVGILQVLNQGAAKKGGTANLKRD